MHFKVALMSSENVLRIICVGSLQSAAEMIILCAKDFEDIAFICPFNLQGESVTSIAVFIPFCFNQSI